MKKNVILDASKAPTQVATLKNYSVTLKQVNEENQQLLLNWRNQKDIREKMVSQDTISAKEHAQWFLSLAHKSSEQHFVIYYKEAPIGAINLKCHDGKPLNQSTHAEVGLYIAEEKYQGNIIAFSASLVINDYAFEQLGISHLSSKVRADNIAALKYNQQLGYELSSEEQGFVAINLTPHNYHTHSMKLKNFLNRGQ